MFVDRAGSEEGLALKFLGFSLAPTLPFFVGAKGIDCWADGKWEIEDVYTNWIGVKTTWCASAG